jgi:endonuclease G
LLNLLEELKLNLLHHNLVKKGLPKIEKNEIFIEHKAFCLVYDEEHEQAKWVAHIINIDIVAGQVSRTNDFRVDSLIKTGSTEDADYFLKTLQTDGTYVYDGFGFDRGHLAPSADFRWSPIALSESYFYSNMSPQRAIFNRGGWGDLEDFIRAYVYENNVPLVVITGPVLADTLPKVKRSKNNVSIPYQYFKVVYDSVNQKGIAFLMPNEEISYPTEYYAKSIKEVEKIANIDFFHNLPDEIENKIENQKEVEWWLPYKQKGDVPPIPSNELPHNYYNSIQAKSFVNSDKKVTICGTVVSSYKSSKGNIFLNLDKQYPNQVFSITIFASSLVNFTYKPEEYLKGKRICVKGKISEFNNIPSMIIENEKSIEFLDEKQNR